MPFIQTPDLNIHFQTAGAGDTPLILLHGNFASWRWWQPVLDRVPPSCRVFALDLRGYGDTQYTRDDFSIQRLADDLLAFAAALELDSFHLVGHSLGGAAALQFAVDHPDRLQSLTLVAPAPAEGMSLLNGGSISPWIYRLFALQRDASLKTLDAVYRALRTVHASRPLLRAMLRQILPTLPRDAAFEALVEDAGRMAPGAIAGYLRSLDTWTVQSELARVEVPVLILWGDRDFIIPRAALERTANGLREGRLVVWRRAGHAPHLEQPERFVRLLMAFVDQHTPVSQPDRESWLQRMRNRRAAKR